MVERGVVMVDRGEEGCGEGREGVLMVYRGVVVVVVVRVAWECIRLGGYLESPSLMTYWLQGQ